MIVFPACRFIVAKLLAGVQEAPPRVDLKEVVTLVDWPVISMRRTGKPIMPQHWDALMP